MQNLLFADGRSSKRFEIGFQSGRIGVSRSEPLHVSVGPIAKSVALPLLSMRIVIGSRQIVKFFQQHIGKIFPIVCARTGRRISEQARLLGLSAMHQRAELDRKNPATVIPVSNCRISDLGRRPSPSQE